VNRINYIFPAAGLGQRFREVGELRPKPLIPVEGIPLLIWSIVNFPILPIDIVWIITLKKHNIKKFFHDNCEEFPYSVRFIELDAPTNGPAETIKFALDEISKDEIILVANTDQFVFADINSFIDNTRNCISSGRILTMRATGPQWSYLTRDEEGFVNKVVEKVEISTEATVGIYSFASSHDLTWAINRMIDADDRVNREFYVAPVYNYLINKKLLISADFIGQINHEVRGMGTPTDLKNFQGDPRIQGIRSQILIM
jgi:NDP-sugar pyrophosphorylase family protein